MDNEFLSVPMDVLIQVSRWEDFSKYADGLALIDDVLCGFDPEREPPAFLPKQALDSGRLPGDVGMISDELESCITALQSVELVDNLRVNHSRAIALRSEAELDPITSLEFVRTFLSTLLVQYGTIIHPAFTLRGTF